MLEPTDSAGSELTLWQQQQQLAWWLQNSTQSSFASALSSLVSPWSADLATPAGPTSLLIIAG